MLVNKTIAVVVPAYNEAQQIGKVIETMPEFVDRIVVVNDASTDNTAQVVKQYIKQHEHQVGPNITQNSSPVQATPYNQAEIIVQQINSREARYFTPAQVVNGHPDHERIILINHLHNAGVGAAIATGYKWCKDHQIDCTAVMAGDGQMDPDELESICRPVLEEGIDYVKGNRLIHRSAWFVIPKIRYFGNSFLSILTKIASGYWHVSDTQTGYTAISKKALNALRIHKIYKRYGMPNDMLVKLNIAFCTLKEVEIKPVYQNEAQQSKMKIWKVIPSISWLLLRSFFKRLWVKYLFRDFHPLFLLYHFAFFLFLLNIPYVVKIVKVAILAGQPLNPVTLLVFMLLFISGFQSLLFAMWMDIQDNERLYK
ncbi:glycosyltransferase [candidate division KSB3 bacterium]|uniref:Glycosyltransferase n=1 Tax=candidate division KSB3 bacterium TaxID=2044937 RepID=A0A9D5JS00_9BACT|nr:glycosyltransferase [candidate division KSB3 bacterium]